MNHKQIIIKKISALFIIPFMVLMPSVPYSYSEVLENPDTGRFVPTTNPETVQLDQVPVRNNANDFLMRNALQAVSDNQREMTDDTVPRNYVRANGEKNTFPGWFAKDAVRDKWYVEDGGVWRTGAHMPLRFVMEFEVAGTHRFEVTAKNIKGALPPTYTHFVMDVMIDGQIVDRISIPAHETEWQTTAINLDITTPGEHEIAFIWMNDSYNPFMRTDANIHVKEVTASYIGEPLSNNWVAQDGTVTDIDVREGVLKGSAWWRIHDDGVWHTNDSNTLVYDVAFEGAGEHILQVEARNHGDLPLHESYDKFLVRVYVDGEDQGVLEVEASNEFRTGELALTIEEAGDHTITLEWLNDGWNMLAGTDANMLFHGIQIYREIEDVTQVVALQTFSPLTVDGDLSESVWSNAPSISFNNPARSDNQVDVKVVWDNENLYFAYQVEDDLLESGSGHLFRDDGAELFIDVGNEAGETMDANDYQLIANIDDLSSQAGALVKTQRGLQGYVMEIAIPWRELGASPAAGNLLGLLLGNNDRDNGVGVQFDHQGMIETGSYSRPNLWGQLLLQATEPPLNRAPVLNPIGDLSDAAEGVQINFSVSGTDEDAGDTLSYSATGLPVGASFDGSTFSWTPDFDQAGEYTITFEVSDGMETDTEIITITVNNVNRAPTLAVTGETNVIEGGLMELTFSGSDLDGDDLTYMIDGLPAGAVFDQSSRVLSWRPGFDQAGEYLIAARVSDGTDEKLMTMTIVVANVNRAPTLSITGETNVDEGTLMELTFSGSDPDGDNLTYAFDGLPEGATYNNLTNTLSWTPSFEQAGNYVITARLSDGTDEVVEVITLRVADVVEEPDPAAVNLIGSYDLKGISGTTIPSSGDLPPLVIADTSKVDVQDGAIQFTEASMAASAGPATDLMDALQATNALTLEAWIKPANDTQGGPARILTLSSNTSNRNFTLGQEGGKYVTRLRTPETGVNGYPLQLMTSSNEVILNDGPQHLIFTRDAEGNAKIYVNGVEAASMVIPGDFSNWDRTMRLALGNELSHETAGQARTYLGDIYHVAVYDGALDASEVQTNFVAGVPGGVPTPEPDPEPEPQPERYQVAQVDVDSDGMDDHWETQHFGNLSKTGNADTDNDGLTDLEEFKNYTDPNVNSNVALHKPYAWPNLYHQQPTYRHTTDAGDTVQLTDGLFVPCCGGLWQENYTNATPEGMLAVGWDTHTQFIEVTVDLESVQNISGVRLSTGGGQNGGVYMPPAVHVLISDNGEDFYYAGDMVAGNTNPEPLPNHDEPGLKYYRYQFLMDGLNTHGRYVKFLMDKPPARRRFVDELQVFTGGTADINVPHTGKSFTDDLSNFTQFLSTKTDTEERLKEVVDRANSVGVNIDAEVASIQGRINRMDFTDEELVNFKSLFPQPLDHTTPGMQNLALIQRDILALNARVLQAEGHQGVVTWESRSQWDIFSHLTGPENGNQEKFTIDHKTMNHERLGHAISFTNAENSEKTLKLNISDLPGGTNPDWVNVYVVQPLETPPAGGPVNAMGVYSDMLVPIAKTAEGYEFTIPSGMSLRVWVEFEPEALNAGTYNGTITVRDETSVVKSVPTSVSISTAQAPENLALGYSAWDYLDGLTTTVLGGRWHENPPAVYDQFEHYQVDGVWGHRNLMRWDTVSPSQFDANNNFVPNSTYYDRLDNWITKYPDARHYYMLMSIKFSGDLITDQHKTFAGVNYETNPTLFDQRVGSWMKALENHLRDDLGVDPAKLSLQILDEPATADDYRAVVRWAQAMKSADSQVKVYENPGLHNPATMEGYRVEGENIFDISDVLSPNYQIAQEHNSVHGNLDYFKQIAAANPEKTLEFYTSSGIGSDAYAAALVSAWVAYEMGATTISYWSIMDGTSKVLNMRDATARPHYSQLYFDEQNVYGSVRMEASMAGRTHYTRLSMLEDLRAQVLTKLPTRTDLIELIDSTKSSAINAVINEALADRDFNFLVRDKDRTVADIQADILWDVIEEVSDVLAGNILEPRPEPDPAPLSFPVDLFLQTGFTEKTVEMDVTKLADATETTLTLDVYDADNATEGELYINGNKLVLFGTQADPINDLKNSVATFSVPADWWVEGKNELRFVHVQTNGFRVDDARVEFIAPDAPEPQPDPVPTPDPVPVGDQPHIQREGVNLFLDPTVDDFSDWTSGSAARFDGSVSRTADGSGSWKLSIPHGEPDKHSVLTDPITVPRSGFYTYSFYVKTEDIPSYVGAQIKLYTESGGFVKNTSGVSWGSNSKEGEWQEIVQTLYIDVNESPKIRLQVFKRDNPTGVGTIHVDDFYFGEGLGFGEPPTPNEAFEGARVQVDELGNFTVDGEPFFPWMMHTKSSKADRSIYTDQGWNTNIWASNNTRVEQHKDVGMYNMFQLSKYIIPGSSSEGDLQQLRDSIQGIKDAGNLDNLIGYYWDNEHGHEQWQVILDVIGIVREMDPDAPIYALQGNFHQARLFAELGLVDLSGTYVGGNPNDLERNGTSALTILNNIQGNNKPGSVAQINSANSHPGELRLRVYNSLIEGARAIGYYGDALTGNPLVEDAVWAADMPALPNEVDQALDIIRTPHWTSWNIINSHPSEVRVGSRELNGKGYLILSNQTTSTQQITLTLDQLGYAPSKLVSIFDGVEIASFNGDSVTFSIPPIGIESGTMILEITSSSVLPPPPSPAPEPDPVPLTFPVNLYEADVTEQIVEMTVSKTVGATEAALTLDVFDPDFSDEGELYINGNKIDLFGDQGAQTNDSLDISVVLSMPAEWWVDGVNELRFVHTRTAGFRIHDGRVQFLTSDPVPPVGQVLLSDYSSLEAAVQAIGGANRELMINDAASLTGDLDIPQNIQITVVSGGKINYGNHTLTIRGEFETNVNEIFQGFSKTGSGNVRFMSGAVEGINPRWWETQDIKATDGNNNNEERYLSTRDGNQLRAAVKSAGGGEVKLVQMPAEEFVIADEISLSSSFYSGITVRGAGRGNEGEELTTIKIDQSKVFSSQNNYFAFLIGATQERIENITLSDFVVNGDHTPHSQGIYTVHHKDHGVHDLVLERISVRDVTKTGFYLAGNVRGTDLLAENGGHSFVARDGRVELYNIIGRNAVNGLGLDVAGGWPSTGMKTDVLVDGFLFENNIYGGIKFATRYDGSFLKADFRNGETRNNPAAGFWTSSVDGVTDFSNHIVSFSNVKAIDNAGTGISLTKIGTSALNNVEVHNSGGYGIQISGRSTGTGIISRNNGLEGIFIAGRDRVELNDIEISGTKGGFAGLSVHYRSGSEKVIINNARIEGNSTRAVAIYTGAIVDLRNLIMGNNAGGDAGAIGAWTFNDGTPQVTVQNARNLSGQLLTHFIGTGNFTVLD